VRDARVWPRPIEGPVQLERLGMAVSARSAFLIEGDTVRAAWDLGSELPDLDAVLAAASSSAR